MSAIIADHLRKIYTSKKGKVKLALDDINLEIPQGSFFGLLGVNGAGKSTFINILAGTVSKTSGSISICGHDIDKDLRAAKYKIGVVPQELVLDPFFPPREVLENTAGYYGIAKKYRQTEKILKAVGLYDKADSPARSLSGGMRRRLLVAKAMVHNPAVLILDEPTAGVDVELREQLWEYIKSLNKAGTTIVLTTHYLEEAQELCDQIAIIDKGKIIANDNKKNILKIIEAKKLIITPLNKIDQKKLQKFPYEYIINEFGQIEITYKSSRDDVGQILLKINKIGVEIKDIATSEADLEDIFRHLIS